MRIALARHHLLAIVITLAALAVLLYTLGAPEYIGG